MPLKEVQLFNATLLQTESAFTTETSRLQGQSEWLTAKNKHKVSELRRFMQGELKDKDFKSIVTSLAERRKGINVAYNLVKTQHYQRYGV